MQIDLQNVDDQDLEALAVLRIEAMRESLTRVGRFDAQRARDRFSAGFSPVNTRHIILDGGRVGFVAVKSINGELLVDHLYIHPDYQNKGIGAWVVGQIFGQADAQGLAVRVGALKGSDSNRFYERHGFRFVEAAEWDNYYVRMPSTPFNR